MLDICIQKEEYNRYKSTKFSSFCNDNLSKNNELKAIYNVLFKNGLYCPTIYKNKTNNNVVLLYETEDKSLYVIISDDGIKYKYNDLTYFSDKTISNIVDNLVKLTRFIGVAANE